MTPGTHEWVINLRRVGVKIKVRDTSLPVRHIDHSWIPLKPQDNGSGSLRGTEERRVYEYRWSRTSTVTKQEWISIKPRTLV